MGLSISSITGVIFLMGCSVGSLSTVSSTSTLDKPAGFVAAWPDTIKWMPNSKVPGVQAATLLGNYLESGPLIVRVKLAANIQVKAHTHPDARTYTVLNGQWKLGFGEKFDARRLLTFPAGSVYRLPARVPHFQMAGSDGTTIQIESIGPTSIEFLEP